MRSLLFKQIKHHKRAFLFTVAILILLITFLPIALSTLRSADATVQMEITDFARGSYDLLVRPVDAHSELEKKIGIVEENYLGVGKGGITLSEWREIQQIEEVEIAAPIAALGYYTMTQRSFDLPILDEPIRYTVSFYTDDGMNTYLVNEHVAYSLPNSEAFFDGKDTITKSELINLFHSGHHVIPIPTTFHPIVAVDPFEEEALTTISLGSLLREPKASSLMEENSKVFPIVNVSESAVPLFVDLKIERLNISNEETIRLIRKGKEQLGINPSPEWPLLSFDDEPIFLEFFDSLSDIETLSKENYSIDFSKQLSALNEYNFFLDRAYQLKRAEEWDSEIHDDFTFVEDLKSQDVYYLLSQVDYSFTPDQIIVEKLNQHDNGIPIYREISAIQRQNTFDYLINRSFAAPVVEEETLTYFETVDTISVNENSNILAASPLGIYNFEETTLNGNPIQPTALPGSFLPLPAHGITSIEWAEHFKGEAPIDAIRVVVTGIDGYTVEAAGVIQQVADKIAAKGFQVDIVAGASHQQLVIDVEGFGTVIQPTTTLGAADTILTSWNVLTVMITGLFVFIGGSTFWNRLRLWSERQRRDEELLQLLGWERKHTSRFFAKEFAYLIVISIVGSGLLLNSLIVSGVVEINVLFLYAVISMFATIIALIAFLLRGRQLRGKVGRPKASLTKKNLIYYQKQLLNVFIQIIMSSVLSIYVFSSLLRTEEKTTLTRLGEYVHVQTEIIQYIILGLAYVLTALTLIEALRHLWRHRLEEIHLLALIGWTRNKVTLFLLAEVVLWSSVAVLIGLFISILIFYVTIGLEGLFVWIFLFTAFWFTLVVLLSWWNVTAFTRKYVYM
ncbi:ABC transporter permease [Anaerobacillus sp. CMMVII]|uniref:ABC transporter permease n=1 Tax=Anaerobacillus sp. CMMVII TaxID=2755588 RepID=UPI0021B781D9|nr:hypothetical protein [Anaerobacillus sp. CMMVII]MCT8138521.1 ABC transporter permease [Anaerobacillus sp. CMMVII]